MTPDCPSPSLLQKVSCSAQYFERACMMRRGLRLQLIRHPDSPFVATDRLVAAPVSAGATRQHAPKTEKNDVVRAPFIVVLHAKTPIEGCGSPQCPPTLSSQFCDNVKSVCWPQSSRKNLAGIERCIELRSGLFVQDTQCPIGVKGY